MGFWDRIRDWFGRPMTNEPPSKEPPSAETPPRPDISPVVKPTDDDTLPLPGDTGIDIFRLLFSNKDKYTTTMLNSISLSSDMKTLYLIDNGRAIPFDLTVREGVLVGLLGEQLVVATAVSRPREEGGTIDPPATGEVVDISGGRGPEEETGSVELSGGKHVFKAGANSQYTISYNGKNRALGIIGVDDISIAIEAPDDNVCTDKVFGLSDKKVLNLRWDKDELFVVEISTGN